MFYMIMSSRMKYNNRKILRLLRSFTPGNDVVVIYKAFTLAEVLITLLIIGVVASIVVPNLINDSQDAEYLTAWKKVYGDLEEATKKIMLDNGGTMKGIRPAGVTGIIHFRNLYAQQMSTMKTCEQGSSFNNCWPAVISWLNGDPYSSIVDRPSLTLNNGASLMFYIQDDDCDGPHWIGGLSDCGTIIVDTNGIKSPNIIGKDVYFVHIMQNSLKPWGCPGDWVQPSTHCKNTCGWGCSWGCAAKYLMQ